MDEQKYPVVVKKITCVIPPGVHIGHVADCTERDGIWSIVFGNGKKSSYSKEFFDSHFKVADARLAKKVRDGETPYSVLL